MKEERPKTTPALVRQTLFASVIAAVTLVIVYGLGPTVFPQFFGSEDDTKAAALIACKMQLSAMADTIKQRGSTRSALSEGPSVKDQVAAAVEAGTDPASMSEEDKVKEIQDLRNMVRRLIGENNKLEATINIRSTQGEGLGSNLITKEAVESAKKLLEGCDSAVKPATSVDAKGKGITAWKGYECGATDEDMRRYLEYKPRGSCPNDWYFVQRLMFKYNCFALPRRRCLAVTPAKPHEPLALPAALFDQGALMDSNVRWDLMQCKSFECLNSRHVGDCRNCFNLELEEKRWKNAYRGALPMAEVLALKKGSIRIGLDVGGGTGSFAAHMARHGVTVMTTAFNVETVNQRYAGLPYMETIALRGLIPLHWPHKARLPFYDGTLDIIHSVNSIKYIPPVDFEELIYEWDRVLRVGGLLWFEMFYAPVAQMPTYISIIEGMEYRKLYWNFTPKPDKGEQDGDHVYLNCVLEKPPRPGTEVLDGPRPEDMDHIV